MSAVAPTRDRIIDASVDLFGSRGVDAVSLDEIAREVGVRKQTVLYWFASKDALVDGVLDAVAAELFVVIDAAVRAAPDDPLERIDNIVRAVFRPAVRRPALLGLFREVSRLDVDQADRLRQRIEPLVERAVSYLADEMEAGRLRRGDPGLVAALGYATLTGIATEPEALRAVGWQPTAAGCASSETSCGRFFAPRSRPDRRRSSVLVHRGESLVDHGEFGHDVVEAVPGEAEFRAELRQVVVAGGRLDAAPDQDPRQAHPEDAGELADPLPTWAPFTRFPLRDRRLLHAEVIGEFAGERPAASRASASRRPICRASSSRSAGVPSPRALREVPSEIVARLRAVAGCGVRVGFGIGSLTWFPSGSSAVNGIGAMRSLEGF